MGTLRKILGFLGVFVTLVGANLGFAHADTTGTTGFGTPDDWVCDSSGCYYCDDNNCYICDDPLTNPTPECRTLCESGKYGSAGGSCTLCQATNANYPYSVTGYNGNAGTCFKQCVSSCSNPNWGSYFPTNSNFTAERFYPKENLQLEFAMLSGANCNMGTTYCPYIVTCSEAGAGVTYACKPGQVAVTFRTADGSNVLGVRYTVLRSVWSTQNTSAGMEGGYYNVFYPTFVTPNAPTIAGKKFIGWYDAQTGGTQRIAPASDGAMYGNLTFDLAYNYVAGTARTLYAQYEDVIYEVQLYPNGGTPNTVLSIYYKGGTFYCDATATNTPITTLQSIFTRCGYTKPVQGTSTFNGYTQYSTGGTQYIDEYGKILSAAYNYDFGSAEGIRWYAQYQSTCDSTIVLDTDGGAFSGTCTGQYSPTLVNGQWMTPTLEPGCLPTRPGYTFMGYRWQDGGGAMYYDANLNPTSTVWPLCDQDKVILEASWEGNCNLITFNDNNANNTNVNANNTQRKRSGATDWLDADPANPNLCGKPLTTNPTVQIPTNANATFLGYYTALTGGTQVFNSSGATTTAGNNWTISQDTILYAHWQCNTGYTWNATTHACEQNLNSVKYMCYTGDSVGKIDNQVTPTDYAVRPVTWYDTCNIAQSNFNSWWFSGDDRTYIPGSIISQWTFGDNETFVPVYDVRILCDTMHWTGRYDDQWVKLGNSITLPTMDCVPKPEYVGWVNLDSQWHSWYSVNMQTPVPGATCAAGDFWVNGGSTFNLVCPTDLTFSPDDELITKTIVVSCGTGGTTGEITVTYDTQNQVPTLISNWLAANCSGSCQNPTGPSHGYWKLCGTWETGAVPNVTPIPGETGCYRAEIPYDLGQVQWANVTNFNITSVSYCPKYVKYKCSDDATNVYDEPPYSYYDESYTVLTPMTVGCTGTGTEFVNWKKSDENVYYDAGQVVANWPYETEVTLVAQWGDAIEYNIIYHYDDTASWDTGNHPDTYTINDLPLTINGVMTRAHSIFIGWCDDAGLSQNCATPRVIPTGTTGDVHFYAKWECEEPYHIGPDTGLCEVCPPNTWWNPITQTCDGCSESFPNSTPPFNWSEDQCWRPCQNDAQCAIPPASVITDPSNACSTQPFMTVAGTQIEFKGNYDAGINACDATNVPYCPYGLNCSSENVDMPRSVSATFWYGADLTNSTTRYIIGLGRWTTDSGTMINGKMWSAIMGPAQQMSFSSSNDAYAFISYPLKDAPDATVPGKTFLGYFSQQVGGTQHVNNEYVLDITNAHSVGVELDNTIPGNRNLYAQYDPIDYTITYNCGTGNPPTPESQTGIHYGGSVTPRNNTCTKPGYNFLGWMVSNSADIQQPGVVFTWNYEESKTFTAKWSDDPIDYTITYDCGTGNPPTPESQTGIHYGGSVTPRNNTCTKPGYNFLGWMVSNSADIQQPGVVFTWNYEESKTFTAKWSDDPNNYVITYKPNYTGATQPDVTQSVIYGQQFTTNGVIFTRPGHIMTGWSTPFPLLNYSYVYNIESDTVLDAQWQVCPAGQTPNSAGTACEPCPEGQYSVNGICTPCPDGTQPNAAGDGCEPCPEGEYGLGGICNPCPAGTQPNSTGTECVPCPDGQYSVNGICMPCPDGYQPNAAGDGCEPCPEGEYGLGGTCEPCPPGYSSNPGATSIDQCFVSECPSGQHLEHGECKDDVVECGAPHAAYATRTWNPTLMAYGSCQIQECIDGYHISSNACVLDEQFCAVPNGRGERVWNGTAWGECEITQCDPGFENTGTACSECANRRVNGEIAVSSYAAECEIATCMYHGQKYILENNECRPICEDATDETGTKHWDDVAKRCVRTCNPGYKMW